MSLLCHRAYVVVDDGGAWRVEVEAGPHEDRLIRRIFYDNHYYQSSRPVENESSAIEVKFGLTLQQIIDVVSLSSHDLLYHYDEMS